MELVCEPVFDYGRTPAEWTLVDDDRHTADATGAGVTMRLQHRHGARHRGRPRARPPRAARRASRPTARCPGPRSCASPADVDEAQRAAGRDHALLARAGSAGARLPDHRWREPIQRSALAIKGLTYMPTGATVAALTTSLPETPGGERNWDYRYTWMRDSTFTLQALHWLNLDWEADEFMQFVADLEPNDDGALQIMYGIDGRRDLTESTRDDLSGYAGARPVRIGNGAFDQRQNDVFGAVLDSILLHTRRSQRLPRRLWPIVEARPSARRAVWREPDQGIWEARGEPQHYVSSKLMCWVAMDRAAKLAEIRGDAELAGAAGARRPRRSAPTSSSTASTTRGVLRQHYDTDALDASTLLAAIFGFLPGDDERLRASVLAIADELTEDGFVLRYRTDETDDGLSGKEGTFLICSFWLVSALAIDRRAAAGARPDGAAAARSPRRSGLYAEEFDADTGRHLGNFPQAFSHLALIEAAGADHRRRAIGGVSHDEPLRRDRDRQRRRRRHARRTGSRPRASGSCCSSAATGCRASRRTGRPRTCSSTTATSPPDTWYDDDGKPFQPQVHYFVGGATKLYGAALYRLRAEDFGELDAPRRHLARVADRLRRVRALLHAGRAALPGARRARRGPDRAARERALPVPGGLATSRASSSSPTTSRRPGCTRSTRRAASCSTRPTCRYSRCVRCATCDGFPCLVHAKSDAEVLGRAAGARARQRHAAHATRGRCGWRPTRPARRSPSVVVERDGEQRDVHRPTSSSSPAARPTRPSCCCARPTTRTRTGWPTAPTRSGATTCSTTARPCWRCRKEREPDRLPEDARASTTSTSAATDFEFPMGNIQMVGKSSADDVPRREAAADQARARVDAATTSPATRSTSGSPPRTCRGRRTASRCATTAASSSPTSRPTRRPSERLLPRAQVAARAPRACTSTTCSRATPTSRTTIPVAGVAHQAGTCRFGADPATSVLDTDCRAHEVDNLYVVDTSFFPSIGAVNPALTAMANALRVGDHLLERLGRRTPAEAAACLTTPAPRS